MFRGRSIAGPGRVAVSTILRSWICSASASSLLLLVSFYVLRIGLSHRGDLARILRILMAIEISLTGTAALKYILRRREGL